MSGTRIAFFLAAALQASPALAQHDSAQDSIATTADAEIPATLPASDFTVAQDACCLLADGTVIELEILEPLNSSRLKRGDQFRLRTSQPVLLEQQTLLPAGVEGVGEVVHANASRGGGKPGELILAARYLEYADIHIPLRGMKLGGSGTNKTQLAMAMAIGIGPFAQFIHGREIEIPVGAQAHAKLAGTVPLPPLQATEGSTADAPAEDSDIPSQPSIDTPKE